MSEMALVSTVRRGQRELITTVTFVWLQVGAKIGQTTIDIYVPARDLSVVHAHRILSRRYTSFIRCGCAPRSFLDPLLRRLP